MTLRTRLIAGLLGLLAVACAAVGLVTYTHLHSVLLNQLNYQVTMANDRYVSCISGNTTDSSPMAVSARPPRWCAQQQVTSAFTAVVSVRGAISNAYRAGHHDPARLTADDDDAIAAVAPGQIRAINLPGYGTYQITASRSGSVIAVTGLPVRGMTDTLRQVAVAELVVFLIALLVTGVLGTAWVGVSLRPLRRVAATATRVTQLPLGRGQVSMPEPVPDANPATEVGRVGAAFNRMLGHVESALARREASQARLRSFAADASHELRTPLAAIRGYTELALRQAGALPPEVAHALRRVESESGRMSVLVDDLLLLARLDAGRPLASDPVDLTRLIIDVTSDMRVSASDHRWWLELPPEPVIVPGDEQRLHQVLANLLGNAARHTPAGTSVTVSLRRRDASASIMVTDDGPGIPAQLLPDVFERFVRGEVSRSRAAGGSGLGLAIVHAVAVAHGGTARVDSRPGETTFTIMLPAAACDEVVQTPAPREPQLAGGPVAATR